MEITPQRFNADRIWRICKECAEKIYAGLPPCSAAVHAAACLLFGTAAQESSLRYERQLLRKGMSDGPVGGFSKWQLEKASIAAGLVQMQKNFPLSERATNFLFQDQDANSDWVYHTPLDDVLWSMRQQDNDYIGVLFSRLHYLRVPAAIPTDLAGQAKYWKAYYNSYLGAGTPEQYIGNWNRLCAATVNGG